MRSKMYPSSLMILSSLACLWLPALAAAQYRPYPTPYPYPPVYSPYGGAGGYLAGGAEVMNAYGQLGISQEQARIEREKANQAKLDTQKQAFDQMLYEKSLRPTYTEEKNLIENRKLDRTMNTPEIAEITAGKTLNTMLPHVQKLASLGIQGPAVPLEAEVVKDINVTAGKGVGPNLGILKNANNLDWPIVVQGPKQEKLAMLLPQVTYQATLGKLDPKLFRQVTEGITELQDDLRKRFRKEEIVGGDYLTGKKYLDVIETAVKDLGQPGSKKYLDGTYVARGRNVPELAGNLTKQGLSFAPVSPGSEAAYQALHSAFVSYITSAQASSGFQLQLRPKLETGMVKGSQR
jgi:hypothetical protein